MNDTKLEIFDSLHFMRKQNHIKKKLMVNPDEKFKLEYETIYNHTRYYIESNLQILRDNEYKININKKIDLMEFLPKGIDEYVIQFKSPYKINIKYLKNMNIIFDPLIETVIDTLNAQPSKNIISYIYCCKKQNRSNRYIKHTEVIRESDLKYHKNSSLMFVKESHLLDHTSNVLRIKNPEEVKLKSMNAFSELTKEESMKSILHQIHKSVKFYLIDDITKIINLSSKQGNKAIVLYTTFTNNSYAVTKDFTCFNDLYIRTNLKNILKNKKINYPILINGSIYIPNLIFLRNSYSFGLIDNPILTQAIITQLFNKDIDIKLEDKGRCNELLIKEIIDFLVLLDYDTVIINLIGLSYDANVCSMINLYLEEIYRLDCDTIKNILFVANSSLISLNKFFETHNLDKKIIEMKYKCKTIVFSEV
jgi:hypothetical protein